MRLIAPTLDRDEEATPESIAEVIPLLEGKEDPFAILEQTNLTYTQVLSTPEGYDLEYQEQNVMNHYQIKAPIPEHKVIMVLQAYLAGDPDWKSGLEFDRKDIATIPTKIGFSLGAFVGGFIKGFKEAREKKQRNSNKSVDTYFK